MGWFISVLVIQGLVIKGWLGRFISVLVIQGLAVMVY